MKTENPHALEFSQERQSEELLPEFSIGMKEARAKTTQFEAHVATFFIQLQTMTDKAGCSQMKEIILWNIIMQGA